VGFWIKHFAVGGVIETSTLPLVDLPNKHSEVSGCFEHFVLGRFLFGGVKIEHLFSHLRWLVIPMFLFRDTDYTNLSRGTLFLSLEEMWEKYAISSGSVII